jgi:tyrosine-specific transport protein
VNRSQIGTQSVSLSKLLSGSFLVAGTAVGAGMLGIPMVTSPAGFFPAFLITILVWAFMLVTGLYFLDITLKMPRGANLLSITHHYLGRKGKILCGGMFLFLYYCLLTAYIAGAAPFFEELFSLFFPAKLSSISSMIVFTFFVGYVIYLGAKVVDRLNILSGLGMIVTYAFMVMIGLKFISFERLGGCNVGKATAAIPILFGAFGYHNVIPTLSDYLEKDRKSLQFSLIIGTLSALIIYLLWQYLIIGAVSKEALDVAMLNGQTAVSALQEITSSSSLILIAKIFASLALLTSLFGVSLSVVDFFADGFKLMSTKVNRFVLCLITFVPPLLFTIYNPSVFSQALGLAGGVGEAFLNGMLPLMLIWASRELFKNKETMKEKLYLGALFLFAFLVIIIEIYIVITT